MNTQVYFDADQLCQFALSRGWEQDNDAVQDRLVSLSNSSAIGRQIIFPMDADANDYKDALQVAAEKIAGIHKITYAELARLVMQSADDTLNFRIHGDRVRDFGIPLNFASQTIKGAQQLLLSAACSTLNPRPYHPRMSRTEAIELLNKSVLRHTKQGSFILNISVPFDAIEGGRETLNIFDKTTFSRRVVINLISALQKISSALDTNSSSKLIDDIIQSDSPLISSNFCDALLKFHENDLDNSLDISVDWSASLISNLSIGVVRFRRSAFAKIEEIRDALRPTDEEEAGTFVGTVEGLDGEIGSEGSREGEVLLAILTQESEVVRARVRLNAADYTIADQAHMGGRTYVQVTGKLLHGRQPRVLTDVTSFSLLV